MAEIFGEANFLQLLSPQDLPSSHDCIYSYTVCLKQLLAQISVTETSQKIVLNHHSFWLLISNARQPIASILEFRLNTNSSLLHIRLFAEFEFDTLRVTLLIICVSSFCLVAMSVIMCPPVVTS